MTTIAYRDRVLVSDSLVSSRDARAGYTRRLAECSGTVGGAVGRLSDTTLFLRWIEAGCAGAPPKVDHAGTEGIVVARDGAVQYWDGPSGILSPVEAPFFALGSGEQFAMGAMAHGASAIDAVKVAIELDNASGGPLHVISLTAEAAHAAPGPRSLTHAL